MNYLNELLESYSRLKQRKLRLLESDNRDRSSGKRRKTEPPSQQAIQAATAYRNQAKQAQPPGTEIPVQQFPPFTVHVAQSGKTQNQVVFNGFPNRQNRFISIEDKQNFDEFARLLDTNQQGSEPTQGTSEGEQGADAGAMSGEVAPGMPQPYTYSIIEGDLLDPITLQSSIDHLPMAEQQLLLAEAGRLQNKRTVINQQGKEVMTLLGAIMQTRKVISCPDPNALDCVATTISDENVISSAQQEAAYNLQIALQILAQSKISLEDAIYLKNTIAISEKNQVVIKDPTSQTGLMIHENNPILVPLLKGLSSKHMIDTDEGSVQLDLSNNRKNFLKNDGELFISKTASTLRGAIFEELRMGVIEMQRCLQVQVAKSDCLNIASEHFTKWSNNSQREDAFRGLVEQCRKDDTICVDLDNSDDIFYLTTIINGFGKGSFNNAEEAFQRFSRVMMQLAIAGVRDRMPTSVQKVASITGFGQKADTREYYATREDAERALRAVGLSNSENVKVVETDKGFALNDSLKFTTEAKKVDLGQASYSNMIPTINCALGLDTVGCNEIIQNQIQMLKNSGLTNDDFKYLKKELEEVREASEKFMEVPDQQITSLPNGKRIVRRSKLQFLKSVMAELDRKDTFDGHSSQLRSKIRLMIDKAPTRRNDPKVWKSLATDIAATIQKDRIEKLLSSDEPKNKRKGLGFIVGLGMFGGGSADRSMLTLADAQNFITHTTDQNETLRPLTDTLKKGKFPKIEVEYNKFIINGNLLIYWDGNKVETIIPLSYVLDAIEGRGIGRSTPIKRKGDQGVEKPLTADSTEYSGQTLNEQVINYLMNQQELLTKLLKSITKGV